MHSALHTAIYILHSAILLFAAPTEPSISLHLDRLPEEEKVYLAGLDSELKRLIGEQTWAGSRPGFPFAVQIDLFFDKFSRNAILRRYEAGILIGLKSGVQFRDRRWEFPFAQEERLPWSDPYHPLTGLVEYYLALACGTEMDRYRPLGGEPYYERARMIAQAARFEALYALGWEERRRLAEKFSDSLWVTLRKAAYHFESGRRFLAVDNIEDAVPHLAEAVHLAMSTAPENLELKYGDHVIRFVDRQKVVDALTALEMWDELDEFEEWAKESEE